MKINIAICDDEIIHIHILKEFIYNVMVEKSIQYNILEFYSGEDLIKNYSTDIDILFLDIQMKSINGIEAAREIRTFDNNLEIIFTTAIAEYVFDAYEVRAFRYILKPLNFEDVCKQFTACLSEVLNKNKTIKLDSSKFTLILPIKEIIYAEVVKKIITIYTSSKEYNIAMTMKKLEQELKNFGFYRCHHSYIVNLKKVTEINGKSVFIDNIEIPLSRSKAKNLKIELIKYLGDKL